MTPEWLSRTELLLGTHAVEKLQNSHVLIAGLGGVGSWATEFIVRSGVGSLTIVDSDVVEPSNINRQLPATQKTIGMAKTDVMSERLLSINPQLKLTIIRKYIHDDTIENILDGDYDIVVDAIDTLSPKVWFLFFALKKGFRIISSMGSGARLDPTKIEVGDISDTHNCTLARTVRKRLKKLGISTGFTSVYSRELPRKEAVVECEGRNKKSIIGTAVFVPAAFGCTIASQVVLQLLEKNREYESNNSTLL
jgi:tRNA A37 threonylcarbamoyladenosine dehydratase